MKRFAILLIAVTSVTASWIVDHRYHRLYRR